MAKGNFAVLIIDDDRDFREIIAAKLGERGFTVYQAGGGKEGIEQLRQYKPDLVLLDVQMPTMNGIATLSAIRSDPKLAATRVVFLTNFGELSEADNWLDEKFAKEIGALGHIRKSDDLETTVGQIEALAAGTEQSA